MKTYELMIQWAGRNREGRLIFDERPFVYYDVIVNRPSEGEVYRVIENDSFLYSGKITLHFKAYDPYGKMMYIAYEEEDTDKASDHCGILPSSQMPPAISAKTGNYLVYNPGTETTDLIIRIAGSAPNGMTITNNTTGEKCELIGVVADPNWIEVNSEEGSVRIEPSTEGQFGFEFHNYGYIRLAPCTPFIPDITIKTIPDTDVIEHDAPYLGDDVVGQYIRINGHWRKILEVQDETHLVIDHTTTLTRTHKTCIVTMNEITISGSKLALTKLELEYEPKVR